MALLVFMFVTILLATFAMVLIGTRKSALEKTIDQRMAMIQIARKHLAGATPEAEQLLKATAGGNFLWLDSMLERYSFSQMLKKKLLHRTGQ